MEKSVFKEMIAEGIGTFILVLFGVGSVAVSVCTGGLSLWPVALMFALGVTLYLYPESLSGPRAARRNT